MPGSSVMTLADLLFLGLVVVCFNYNKWSNFSWDLSFRDLAFVALLLWSVLSVILSPVVMDLNAIAREGYLVLLFLFFRLGRFENGEFTYAIDGYILGCIATVFSGLFGVVLLAFFDITNPWAYELKNYPYLDGWARAHGLSLGPNMLASFLVIALILSCLKQYSIRFSTASLWVIRFVLILGCVLALSRSLLAIIFAFLIPLCVYVHSARYRRCSLALGFLIGLSSVFVSANLVIQFSQLDSSMGGLSEHGLVSHGSSIFSYTLGDNSQVDIYRSVYLELKKAALEVFYKFPLFGIGDGNFYGYLAENSKDLGYPASFSPYNPHSTYFGLLSENGVIGLFIFFVFVGATLSDFLRNSRTSVINERLFWICIIYLLYEGVNTDQLNFRHYIVFLALYFRLTYRPKNQVKFITG